MAFLKDKLGEVSLLEKIQHELSTRYKYLSDGQAKSVIKRFLHFTLTSAERNDIYKLRKKIEEFKKFVNAFDGNLSKSKGDILDFEDPYVEVLRHSEDEIIDRALDSLNFMCFECKTYTGLTKDRDVINPPIHHETPMTLNWTAGSSKLSVNDLNNIEEELTSKVQNRKKELEPVSKQNKSDPRKKPENSIDKKINSLRKDSSKDSKNPYSTYKRPKLYCKECKQKFELSDDLWREIQKTDHRIELPSHHEKEMELRLHPNIENELLTDISNKIRQSDLKPGSYYYCLTCGKIIPVGDSSEDKTPTHHDQKMVLIAIPS